MHQKAAKKIFNDIDPAVEYMTMEFASTPEIALKSNELKMVARFEGSLLDEGIVNHRH